MDKQKHNTSFTQLSDTELQSIIGGDWWIDFFKGHEKLRARTTEKPRKTSE